jgi:hypothetical protein
LSRRSTTTPGLAGTFPFEEEAQPEFSRYGLKVREPRQPAGSRAAVVRLRDEWAIPTEWLQVMDLESREVAVLIRPDGHIQDRAHAGADELQLRLSGKEPGIGSNSAVGRHDHHIEKVGLS